MLGRNRGAIAPGIAVMRQLMRPRWLKLGKEKVMNDHFFVLEAPVCSTGVFDRFVAIDYKLYCRVYEMFDESSLIYVGY